MSASTRRTFLQQGTAAALLGAAGPAGDAAQPNPAPTPGAPDLIVVGATVYTVDERQPLAEALAVKDGRFLAIGSTADIRRLAGRQTQVIDAAKMTVVPGFIDAHCHPASAGLSELLDVNCDHRSIAEIRRVIQDRAAKVGADAWIHGFKYDDTKLTDDRPLTRADLDQAAPKHPVRVMHRGGHTCVVNSRALQLAGVTRNTPDPDGGRFGRDERGELTGFIAEHANAVIDKVARRPEATRAQRQAGVRVMSELMSAAGLTSVHDAITTRDNFVAYQDALAANEMRFRVYCMATHELFLALRTAGLRSGFGDDRLRVGGVKLFCDGSASERTMRMSRPYVGRPNDFGILVTTQERLNEQVSDIHSSGFQVGVHANGDVAIDMVLQAYELALRLHPRRDSRHRIEHCTLVTEALLKRIASIGAIPTPFYTYVYYHGDKWAQYGEERLRWMFAHRSFLDNGIRVAGASDYVPGPYEPLMAIQSMVTRRDYRGRTWGANQRITVSEALRVCTINGAHASFEERLKGSISEGKLADFVILADDPHRVDPERIKDIRVVRTVVGGRSMYPNAER
jgi:predicted amidohydrolase YtcJ